MEDSRKGACEEARKVALQCQTIQNDVESDIELHKDENDPHRQEGVTNGGKLGFSDELSSLEDRLTTEIQRLSQAVLQLQEFVVHGYKEHRSVMNMNSGSS